MFNYWEGRACKKSIDENRKDSDGLDGMQENDKFVKGKKDHEQSAKNYMR